MSNPRARGPLDVTDSGVSRASTAYSAATARSSATALVHMLVTQGVVDLTLPDVLSPVDAEPPAPEPSAWELMQTVVALAEARRQSSEGSSAHDGTSSHRRPSDG